MQLEWYRGAVERKPFTTSPGGGGGGGGVRGGAGRRSIVPDDITGCEQAMGDEKTKLPSTHRVQLALKKMRQATNHSIQHKKRIIILVGYQSHFSMVSKFIA